MFFIMYKKKKFGVCYCWEIYTNKQKRPFIFDSKHDAGSFAKKYIADSYAYKIETVLLNQT